MTGLLRLYVTAGIAIVGAGFWLAAATDGPAPTATPAMMLTSVESILAPPPLSPPTGTTTSSTCDPLCQTMIGSTTPASQVASPRFTAAVLTTETPRKHGLLISRVLLISSEIRAPKSEPDDEEQSDGPGSRIFVAIFTVEPTTNGVSLVLREHCGSSKSGGVLAGLHV
jgi:hypothetical protein